MTIVKEGVLYKQREHLRGWLPRYFTLDQNFLHYFLKKDDILPRNSLQICPGIRVVNDVVAKVSNGITYYPFTIMHPNSSQQYHLSAVSLSDSISWAKTIQALANGDTIPSSISSLSQSSNENTKPHSHASHPPPPPPASHGLSSSPALEPEDLSSLSDWEPIQRKLTLQNLNEEMAAKVEQLVDKILSFTVNCSEAWTPMFDRHGVVGMKRPGNGLICVRGETVMPYTIPEIYGLISMSDKRKELDPQLDTYTRMKEYSYHTGTEHLLFKAIWPTAPRDFVNITHWRLLKNGTFLTIGFGEQLPDCPEQEGVVRGHLLIGGYVMQPVKGGTRVFIVVQSDVGGNLPSAITNIAAESQPMVLITLKRLLDQTHKGKQRPDLNSIVPEVSYSDILSIERFNIITPPQHTPTPSNGNDEYDDDDDRSSSDHSFTSEETMLRDSIISSIGHQRSAPIVQSPLHLKEGILYKQREVIKGWRPRYFKLDSHFLHYYLHKSDVIPRKTLQINRDVRITMDPTPRVVNGTAYFPFHISSPKSSTIYHLSSYHQEETSEWVKLLKSVASSDSSRESFSASGHHKRKNSAEKERGDEGVLSRQEQVEEGQVEEIEEQDDDSDEVCYHKKATLSNLTPEMASKLNQSVELILDLAFGAPEEWSLLFEKKGVTGSRKLGSGIICVRGETILPYTIPEIYGIISRAERRKQLDSMLETYARVKWFSHHTGVEYLQSKGVWPTAPRDFSNISHWRLLKDGTFVTLGYGEQIEECPERDGFVRGNLIIGGYVMQHVPGGTRILIIVQLNLGGTLPTAVTNLAAQSQPMVLLTMRHILDREYNGKPRPDMSNSLPPTYQDLFEIAKENVGTSLQKKTKKLKNSTQPNTSFETSTPPKESTVSTQLFPHAQPRSSGTLPSAYLKTLLLVTFIFFAMRQFGRFLHLFQKLFFSFVSPFSLSTAVLLILLYLFVCADYHQKSFPSGKQIYQFRVTFKDLVDSCDENLLDPSLRLNASHVLLWKLSKILLEHPAANGSVYNGFFYRSPTPTEVDVSLLLKSTTPAPPTEEILKLSYFSSKSIAQLAAEIAQQERQEHQQQRTKNSKPWTVTQMLALGYHRILCTLLPGFRHPRPLPHSNSPYGAALILPLSSEDGGAGAGMAYLMESPSPMSPIRPAITVCLTNTATFTPRTLSRNPSVHISLVIERDVMSLHEGAAFAHRLGRSLERRS